MKKRRRLKKKPVIILIVVLGLFIFLITSCSRSCSKKEKEVEIIKKETTFIDDFTNNTNEVLPEKVKNQIIDFFDIYYLSLKELNEYDMRYLFKDEMEAYINQATMNFLINYRKLQRNDLTLDKCRYSLKASKIIKDENELTIVVLENAVFTFSFMKDIDSKIYNVENKFVFKINNNEYELIEYDKEADYYRVISSNISESPTKESVKNVLDEALSLSSAMLENEKSYYQNLKEIPTKKCNHTYDREKATAYALSWITTRNPVYASFDIYGGNCQNYASQVLRSGGIPNDVKGYYRFKYYSSVPDETEASIGRTPSWAGVTQFYIYAKYNQNAAGLCSTVDLNYFYGEKGDLVQFGYKEKWSHTSVITGSVNENGSILDLLTSSNTTDCENFPLSAYNYPNKRLIKIYGWND